MFLLNKVLNTVLLFFSLFEKIRFTKVFTFDKVLPIYKYSVSKILFQNAFKFVENKENFIYKGNVEAHIEIKIYLFFKQSFN